MDYWTLDYKLTRDKYIFMDTNFEVNYGTKDRAELHSLQSYLHSSFHLKYNGGKLRRKYSFLSHFSKMYSQDDSKSFFTAIKGTLYSRFVRQRRVLSIHETPFQTLNVSIFQIRFSEWWPFSDGNFCSIFKHIALSWGSLCVARSSQTWVNSKHTLEFFVLHLWVAGHFLQGSSQMGQWIGLFCSVGF